MNSVGHITAFLNLISQIPQPKQRWIILREMLIALLIMVFFFFFGNVLLASLDVSHSTIQISGGIVLFLIAIKMISPQEDAPEEKFDKEDPFIVPLATPMIAGPSIAATIMLYAHTEESSQKVLFGILIAWVCSVSVFWFALRFRKRMNAKALIAAERLMGLILTLLSVEMFLKGLKIYILLRPVAE